MKTCHIEAMKRARSKEDFAKVVLEVLDDLILWDDKPDYLEDAKSEILSEVWAIFGDN